MTQRSRYKFYLTTVNLCQSPVCLCHKHTGDWHRLTVDSISTSATMLLPLKCRMCCAWQYPSAFIISRILERLLSDCHKSHALQNAGACSTRQNKITAVAHSSVTRRIHHCLAGVLSVCLVPGSKHRRRVSKHSVTIHALFIMTQKATICRTWHHMLLSGRYIL